MQSINLLTHQWAENNMGLSRFFSETTSTNEVSKKEFPDLNLADALYLSDHQSEGKGRDGRNWMNTAPGEALLSTWCFKVQHTVQHTLTPLLGLGLYNSLKKMKESLPLRLKAPNDIYLNDGKLSGLLVEATSQGKETFVYVGLGMNIFASPNVDIITSHLSQEINMDTNNWSLFCDNFYRSSKRAIEESQNGELTNAQCEQLLNALNQRVPEDKKIIKVHPDCSLETSQGLESWINI